MIQAPKLYVPRRATKEGVTGSPQEIGTQFMCDHARCAVWGGCGIGKTTMTTNVIATFDYMGAKGPTLVAGPMRVARDIWPREPGKWEQFKHLKVRWIGGSPVERAEILRMRPFADIYSIGYENLPWLIATLQNKFFFRQMIADESDHLKGFRLNKGTSRSHAIARVAHTFIDRWVNLTGTPAPHSNADLWGQTWFLDKGERLGKTFSAFSARWFKTNPYSRKTEELPYAAEQIHDKLKDICLTLDPRDYFDLSEPLVTNIPVRLPPGARTIYQKLERELFAELQDGKTVEVFNEAALSNKCLQLANGAVYSPYPQWSEVHNEKIEALRSIISETGGQKIIVSYSFRSDVARLKTAFPAAAYLASTEGYRDFIEKPEVQLGLAHEQSLGHGVDGLHTVCHILARFGHTWNAGKRIQMFERIGPMRQFQINATQPVQVFNIVAEDTLDEEVIERDITKVSNQDALLTAMKRRGG